MAYSSSAPNTKNTQTPDQTSIAWRVEMCRYCGSLLILNPPWCRPPGAGSSGCWPGWWTWRAAWSPPAPRGPAPPCGPARRRARTRTPSWSRGCTPAHWAHRQWGNSRNVSHWEAVTTLVHMLSPQAAVYNGLVTDLFWTSAGGDNLL